MKGLRFNIGHKDFKNVVDLHTSFIDNIENLGNNIDDILGELDNHKDNMDLALDKIEFGEFEDRKEYEIFIVNLRKIYKEMGRINTILTNVNRSIEKGTNEIKEVNGE